MSKSPRFISIDRPPASPRERPSSESANVGHLGGSADPTAFRSTPS